MAGMLTDKVSCFAASMRPEHGCSGNERLVTGRGEGVKGFNEAGARMLRKCLFIGYVIREAEEASMRPEHGCSGNVEMSKVEGKGL